MSSRFGQEKTALSIILFIESMKGEEHAMKSINNLNITLGAALSILLLSLFTLLCCTPAGAQDPDIPSPYERVAVKNIYIGLAGSPGAGKTTQGTKLSLRYGIPLVSVVNILRLEIDSRTELGKKVGPDGDKGNLVPSALLAALVRERLSREDCKKGFILDGFPRRQEDFAPFQAVLNDLRIPAFRLFVLEVAPEVLVERLQNRRVCDKGHSYDLKILPPQKEGICDIDGLPIYQQEDDKPERIKSSFELYRREIAPVIEYYKKNGACTIVDGKGSIDTVFRRLVKLIEPEDPGE
jgi:adenylate kinase